MKFLLAGCLMLVLLTGCRRDRGDDPSPAGTDPASATATVIEPSATPTATPASTAASSGDPFSPGVHPGSMMYAGIERTYRVYVPSSLNSSDHPPLLIGLHGGFGTGQQFENNSEFDAAAETGRFIAVYPDGTGVARTWNGGACCGYAARENIDDVGFISALIDEVASQFTIDTTRVYAVGHSNGGIMSLRLACELSDRIAAVGAVAGSLETSGCSPSRPVSVLVIHGDADQNHPIAGGEGPDSVAGVPFNSVADTMETMRAAMGCSGDTNESAAGDITTTDWLGCPSGTQVRLQVIAGGSHAWPGARFSLVGGEPSQAMEATEVLWDFVSQFSTP
jgi:polyhydroxybutyrate depolymerase